MRKIPRPPLLELPQDRYRYWFEWLYLGERYYYVLRPKRRHRDVVSFKPPDYDHATTFQPASHARRNWDQKRAERLFWIWYTLEYPTEVRRGKTSSRLYFLLHTDDAKYPWYVVVTEEAPQAATQYFVTAYPLTHAEAKTHRNARDHPQFYPSKAKPPP